MVNVLREYNKWLTGRAFWARYYPKLVYNFWGNIHPSTERQFQAQRFMAGVSPWYSNWMVSRSMDERNRVTRDQYSIGFGDITYPWLSNVTSANEIKTLGTGAWQFSKNMSRLYH